jgi:hypothetical protein
MAYPHVEYEVFMFGATNITVSKVGRRTPWTVNLGATGAGSEGSAVWRPGIVPHVIRNVAVINLGTAAFVTKPVISIRTTHAGATQSVSGNQVTSLTLTSIAGVKASGTTTSKNVWYKSSMLNTIVNPGQQVTAVVTTKATIGASRAPTNIVLYVEPKWETPANISNMKTG